MIKYIVCKIGSLSLLSIIIFTMCGKSNNGFDFEITEKISYKEFEYPVDLGRAFQLIVDKKKLFINDYLGDSLISVYDIQKKHVDKFIIGVGNGPNELKSPIDIQISNKYLLIYSRPLFTMLRINKDDIQHNIFNIEKTRKLPPLGDRFIPLSDSIVVFSGMWDKRYAMVNILTESEPFEFGDYPNYINNEEEVSTMVKAIFHQSKFAKHPSKEQFVSCSSHVIETYSVTNNIPTLGNRLQVGKYNYAYQQGDIVSTQDKGKLDPRILNVAASDDAIYIVMEKEYKGTDRKCHIKVVDWNLNPIKILDIDRDIQALTIENGLGYAIINDPENKLVFFDL